MRKILRNEQMKKFATEYLNKYKEEIFNIILILDDKNSGCIINGIDRIKMNKDDIKKYM